MSDYRAKDCLPFTKCTDEARLNVFVQLKRVKLFLKYETYRGRENIFRRGFP